MDSSEKLKKNPEEMGHEISIVFQQTAIKDIFKECLAVKDKNEKSWRFELIDNVSDEKELFRMAKEWVLLEILLQGKAILDYFDFEKNKNQGQRIYETFIETCGKELFKGEIFDSLESYYKQSNEAIDEYENIIELENRAKSFTITRKILDRISGSKGKWEWSYFLFVLEYYLDRYLFYQKILGKTIENVFIN